MVVNVVVNHQQSSINHQLGSWWLIDGELMKSCAQWSGFPCAEWPSPGSQEEALGGTGERKIGDDGHHRSLGCGQCGSHHWNSLKVITSNHHHWEPGYFVN